ncbi:hypothetical protein EZS27_020533 [termite gut metagenome]|uniref:Transposase InsH N-terminal domain-containing protein n=1 Tax=termite gut metagenome TaxID=433724 RepID=A0A5J4RAS7_9ZZZZ
MRFLDLSIANDIPENKTVWHFRERLTDLGVVAEILAKRSKSKKLRGIMRGEKIVFRSYL